VETCRENLQQCLNPVLSELHGMSPESIRQQILEYNLDKCRYNAILWHSSSLTQLPPPSGAQALRARSSEPKGSGFKAVSDENF